MESWEAIAISQALRLGQFWHACNMPLTAHRHVNGKPLKIGINWRKFVPFHPLDLQKTGFFKSVLSRNVAFGMEWTRHQLAPAMPGQKIVDRAVAGRVPDGLFVGRLEIMDVQHFASPGGLGKTPQQGLFLSQRHVLAFAPAARLRLESFDAAVVVGHVRPVHCAQRNPHCIRNRRLRHPAFTQQYHLNALPLSLGHFPVQRRLQLPNLAFRAFDHPSLPKQMATGNHTISLAGGTELPQTRRFNQLWKWYYTQDKLYLICYRID